MTLPAPAFLPLVIFPALLLYLLGWHHHQWKFEMWGNEFDFFDFFHDLGVMLSTLLVTMVILPVFGLMFLVDLCLELAGCRHISATMSLLPVVEPPAAPNLTRSTSSTGSDGNLSETLNPMFEEKV